MDYPRHLENGWLIGTGHGEAACKTVIAQRLKGSGMRWSAASADAVCHVRALFKSAKGRWKAFWHSHTAQTNYQQERCLPATPIHAPLSLPRDTGR
jgi:hypothetical protein